MKKSLPLILLLLVAGFMVFTGTLEHALAKSSGIEMHVEKEDLEKSFAERPYSPWANRGYANKIYWGDTHLHTALSVDAGSFGNRLGMDAAYRFARGEEVTSSTGQRVRLSRPLDFMVIADHSDGMGFFQMLFTGDPAITEDETGRRWSGMIQEGGEQAVNATIEMITAFGNDELPWKMNDPKLMRPVWDDVVKAAERYNEPGVFTAFIGYEWTSLVRGNNLHRVVIYRDDASRAGPTLPFTLADSADPEDLWDALSSYEERTGGKVLALAHNGNLSNGMMFAEIRLDGSPLTVDYARERMRWEPIYEVTQIKGDGEAHPFLSPDDEFADYENWDVGNLDLTQAKTDDMLKYEYGRSALKIGLKFQQDLGVNPYQFGMVGSTDSHTSLATAEEENFFGKHSGAEPSTNRATHPFMETDAGRLMGWDQVSSGYAAVWAKENTREALWDAMKRREVYATTGSRIMVRFFGGWDFEEADGQTRFPAQVGYKKGVPMGGELHQSSNEGSPTFLVGAMKDPFSGNLDRIQIVKGWVDKEGGEHERIYDIAVSDGRKISKDGRCKKAVGNTVDIKTATWTNTIGDPELITVWADPDFDPDVPSFYYARVIEIPTPRWTLYDKVRLGAKMPEDTLLTTQERAYTSPIWYTP